MKTPKLHFRDTGLCAFLMGIVSRADLADAKWSEHPDDSGKLTLVRREMEPAPASALICRTPNRYPIAAGIEALPLADLSALLEDRFP